MHSLQIKFYPAIKNFGLSLTVFVRNFILFFLDKGEGSTDQLPLLHTDRDHTRNPGMGPDW